jgi:hypothetical protein
MGLLEIALRGSRAAEQQRGGDRKLRSHEEEARCRPKTTLVATAHTKASHKEE